ncbi:MAG: hypothetical protein QXU79_02320 [Candidatus Micrarchaeaceae archaeon]
MRTKILITAFLILILVVVVWTAFERGYPRAQAGSRPTVPMRATCGPAPDVVDGWVKVVDYLGWSGCVDNECWSEWTNQGANWLMENKDHRCKLDSRTPDTLCNPVPNDIPPNIIYDRRDRCEGIPAAGTWYHNAFALPEWVIDWFDPAGPIAYCIWQMDLSKQYWNFAENDKCQVCVEPTAGPTYTPGGTPVTTTPAPTECYTTPMVNPTPTEGAPPPTAFVPNPPTFIPAAFIHSRYDPHHGVYPARPTFYWPWQEFLHASLTANVEEPSQPGCSVSTDVRAFWFEGSRWTYRGETVVREVCPIEGSGDPNCRWRPIYEGDVGRGVNPDISAEEWIHLIWARSSTEVRSPATWEFHPVGPIWVEIHYHILALTTYRCGEFTYTAPWTEKLVLRVGMIRSVITGGKW